MFATGALYNFAALSFSSNGNNSHDEPLFFLINSYTTGLQPAVLTYMLSTELKSFGGHCDSQEVGLPVSSNGLVLPCGASGRWMK